MAHSDPTACTVLVATPTIAFGDLIRHSLEETGKYRVHVVHTAAEARAVLASTCCQIAVLDNDLSDSRLRELAQALYTNCPELKLVLIPPENDPQHPDIQGLASAAFLRKPFYLPDLIELMADLSAGGQAVPPASPELLRWINQPILDQMLATTSASAGAVARRAGGYVLGGSLPEGAEAGLVALLDRFWQRDERTDLVRFARLDSSQGSFDCLIYLTAIKTDADTAAGLVYPIHTPLSKVRIQAGPLIHALHELAAQSSPELKPARPAGETIPEDAGDPLRDEDFLTPEPRFEGDPNISANELTEPEGEFPSFNLADLLGAIPSPDPNGKSSQPVNGFNGWLPESIYQTGESNGQPPDSLPAEPPSIGENLEDLSQPAAALFASSAGFDSPADRKTLDAPLSPENTPLPASPDFDALTIAASGVLEDPEAEAAGEQGSVLASLTSLNQLEPASAGLSQLNYTCVLIPRLPQHYLTRELSEKVGQWIQQLCLAFGWRLEGIALRPEYLQWTVQVAPTISPGNIVKIVRQRTSEFIFDQFQNLRQQNPSGDFWATGYLIVSGSQPPSAGLLRDYIQQTRRRQGIAKNPGETAPRLNS